MQVIGTHLFVLISIYSSKESLNQIYVFKYTSSVHFLYLLFSVGAINLSILYMYTNI